MPFARFVSLSGNPEHVINPALELLASSLASRALEMQVLECYDNILDTKNVIFVLLIVIFRLSLLCVCVHAISRVAL